MTPSDPVHVCCDDDWKQLAAEMKFAAGADDHPESYSQTAAEAAAVRRLENFSEEEVRRLRDDGASRAVWYKDRLLSLCLSADGQHGHQWHLSLAEVVGPQRLGVARKSDADAVCNAFFSRWESVPNPGLIREILHFVGDS